MSEFDVDVAVLGGGPGGYYAAIKAAQMGAKVALVEKNKVGGTCLNVGCIPTKVLLSCISVLESVKNGADFGVNVSDYSVDVSGIQKRKADVVNGLVGGVVSLLKKNKIELIEGFAKLVDKNTVAIGDRRLTSKNIILATGSEPAVIPIPGLAVGGNVWTSNEALEFTDIPKSMVIIGAGAIGLEFGYTFTRLGCEVTVVEFMPQILPATDTESAKELQKHLKKAGMNFMLNSQVTKAEDIDGGKKVYIKSGDKEKTIDCEIVLMAVGRRAVKSDMGFEEVGVECDKRMVITNDYMQTSVPNIYAIGDVTSGPMLAHVAWSEAIVAVDHIMGKPQFKKDYSTVPACVYTHPEQASVGMTEEAAKEKYGDDVVVGKFGFGHNGKALGMGGAVGFIKIISEKKYGAVLGVHMVGPHVTDLITEMAIAKRNELTIDEVIATIHPHPTLAEVVQEATMDVFGCAIHK